MSGNLISMHTDNSWMGSLKRRMVKYASMTRFDQDLSTGSLSTGRPERFGGHGSQEISVL